MALGEVEAAEPRKPSPSRRVAVAHRSVPMSAQLVSAGLGVGVGLVSVVLSVVGLRGRRKRGANKRQVRLQQQAAAASKAGVELSPDLTPFGSPVGGTPIRVGSAKTAQDGTHPSSGSTTTQSTPAKAARDAARSDSAAAKDQKDNQRQYMTEISELQRQLAVLQRVHEEDRRAQQFLEEYKAQGEVLRRLEREREQQQQVISRLEVEIKDLKANPAVPFNGEQLAVMKRLSGRYAGPEAHSTYSNADSANQDTTSLDNSTYNKMTRMLKGMLAMPRASPAPSQPSTPRGTRVQQPREVNALVLESFIGGRLI